METQKTNLLTTPTWIEKLRSRWKLNSVTQVILVLCVFACTGFTVMFLKPVIHRTFFEGAHHTLFTIIYYILILPFYNILLLFYGFFFGQFKFFWEFEKKFFSRIFKKKR